MPLPLLRRGSSRLVLLPLLGTLTGCSGGDGGLGAPCSSGETCDSGFCMAARCADPGQDADGDGIANEEEVSRGLDPTRADSDRDGTGDGAEPEEDCDGDEVENARESASRDGDGDGVPDQFDPRDDRADFCPPRTEPRQGTPVEAEEAEWPACDGKGSVIIPPLPADACLSFCCLPREGCGDECAAGLECVDGGCRRPADAGGSGGGPDAGRALAAGPGDAAAAGDVGSGDATAGIDAADAGTPGADAGDAQSR